MAKRPVFIAKSTYPYYIEKEIEFQFHSGFAITQKQKSIMELHKNYKKAFPESDILEISTKSLDALGIALSAFNLQILTDGKVIPLECAFQGSKKFEKGGPYTELYKCQPWEAKKYPLLKESGELISFVFEDEVFSNKPRDFFYNWIYIKALCEHEDYLMQLQKYDAFTDIEFNPKKSINCQAKTIAVAVGLMRAGILSDCLKDKLSFLEIVYKQNVCEKYEQISFL